MLTLFAMATEFLRRYVVLSCWRCCCVCRVPASLRGALVLTLFAMAAEFLRRYVVLEHEMLSYFDTETSAKANDTIEKRDMLSVTATTDNRCAS